MTIDLLIVFLLLLLLLLGLYLLKQIRRSDRLLRQMEAGQEIWLRKELNGHFAQLEAYLSLRGRLDLREGLPFTKDWSASPDFLKLIVEHCLDAKPQTVLECSSGLTTLMLARCCQMSEQGRVYSLENGEEYANQTRGHIERYKLDDQGSVIHAPLAPVKVAGRGFQWYDLNQIPDFRIDMLVIDGPPGFIQRHSRYPALPLLYDRLADGCVVFMDDAAREDEWEIAGMWQQAYPSMEHKYLKTERGCSVFVIHK